MRAFTLVLASAAALALNASPAAASDTNMSCEEITAEMSSLNEIITAAGDADVNNKVAQAGASAAVTGALWGGAGSAVPFLGNIANVATAVTSANAESTKKNAEAAEKRMIKLQTISEMKGCR